MKPNVLVIAGATASGKTALGVEIAKKFPVELINADALQVFRHLNVGTAKPTENELKGVTVHLLDILNPDEPFTAVQYSQKALQKINEVINKKKLPVLVGGSGFYIRAIEKPPIDLPKNSSINDTTPEDLELLREKDPLQAKKIHPNDRYRMGRAVELIKQGIIPSEAWASAQTQDSLYEFHFLGVDYERNILHERINARVVQMFENGIEEETKQVLKKFPEARKRLERSIGYCETLQWIEKSISKDQAIVLTQQATRQYAKRQLTWQRKEMRMTWLSPKALFDKTDELVGKLVPK